MYYSNQSQRKKDYKINQNILWTIIFRNYGKGNIELGRSKGCWNDMLTD